MKIKKHKVHSLHEERNIEDFDDLNEIIDEDTKIPWHFWLVVGLIVLYLGFRFVQIIVKLFT